MKKLLIAIILLIGTQSFAQFEPQNGEVIFSSSQIPISVTDPTIRNNAQGSSYPGGRGANQLVIYTPAFGERTNTNEFGTEAVVQNNIITLISGANSFIPEDGYVISGHGKAKSWMTQNLAVGTKVLIEDNTLYAYTTSESYMYEADEKIQETRSMIDFYRGKAANYAWKNSDEHIQNAREYLKKAKKDLDNQENVKNFSELALKEANEAMETVLPVMPNEVKGVWIRPTEKNEAQIRVSLDTMKNAGINNVFLETFYHGKTIFPSKTMANYGFTTQNEQFAGFDPLKVWINEAHKRNMKVHIWFQSFYVGNIPPSGTSILAIHPEWGNKTKADYASYGATRSTSEHNGYFLDPANPEVQNFLTELINEIICKYCPDGINLDYIRYPQSVTSAWGYTPYARQDFKDMYGTDPIFISPLTDLWDEWDCYRREHITNFVRKIGTIGRRNGVYISTVIFPDIESALNTKQQDWRTWSKRNYINGFTPLFLTYDPKMVASMMDDIIKIKSPSTDIYAGIFVTFMGGSLEDLVRQIHETRKLNANGVILFDYAHTTKKYTDMLSKSAFNQIKAPVKKVEPKKKKFWFFK